MSILYIRDKDGTFVPIKAVKGKDGKSAYEYAVSGGYEGTEEEFIALLNGLVVSEDAKHGSNFNNPHKVTAKQAGAIPEVYYHSEDLNIEITQGGNKMTVCYYNTYTENTPYKAGKTVYAHGMVITNAHTEQYGVQLCLPSGDNSIYLRRGDKQGISEWLKLSPEEISEKFEAVVKKTGDTMTGSLKVNKPKDWEQYVILTPEGCYRSFEANGLAARIDVRDTDNANDRRFLDIYSKTGQSDLAYAARLVQMDNGVATPAYLLHTKNKPTNTYTGNGENRTITIGGIGFALLLASEAGHISLVTGAGCVSFFTNAMGDYYTYPNVKFVNGVLTLPDANCNMKDVTYHYQVL